MVFLVAAETVALWRRERVATFEYYANSFSNLRPFGVPRSLTRFLLQADLDQLKRNLPGIAEPMQAADRNVE